MPIILFVLLSFDSGDDTVMLEVKGCEVIGETSSTLEVFFP